MKLYCLGMTWQKVIIKLMSLISSPVPVSYDTTFVTDISEVITTTIDTTIDGSDTTITTTVDTTYEYIQVVDKIDTTFQGEDTYFVFEGYNVYQHETESGSGATKRIATF